MTVWIPRNKELYHCLLLEDLLKILTVCFFHWKGFILLECWLLIANLNANFIIKCKNFSRAETNQGRKLLIFRRFWPQKLFAEIRYFELDFSKPNISWLSSCIESMKMKLFYLKSFFSYLFKKIINLNWISLHNYTKDWTRLPQLFLLKVLFSLF